VQATRQLLALLLGGHLATAIQEPKVMSQQQHPSTAAAKPAGGSSAIGSSGAGASGGGSSAAGSNGGGSNAASSSGSLSSASGSISAPSGGGGSGAGLSSSGKSAAGSSGVMAAEQGSSPMQHTRRLSTADIGIITPYKAMADELRKLKEARGVEVNTVDAFQVNSSGSTHLNHLHLLNVCSE
jgi:hypothetical protein